MNVVAPCPDPKELQELLLGRLPEEVAARLEEHVESCEQCGRLLPTLPADDALVDAMRASAPDPLQPSDQAAIRELVSRLHELRTSLPAVSENTPDAHPYGDASPMSARLDPVGFLNPPKAPDEIGWLGPYRVLKKLGQGGMGVVFLAEDPQLQRTVALKVMLPEVAKKPVARQRFLREARAIAKLEHDHIVTIYQVGEDHGVPYLAMQMLKGMSLEDYLKKKQGKTGTPLSVGQILKLGLEIARGLTAAHEQGLIHRDIKPANIWLDATANGRVKILDFGLARAVEGESHHTTLTQLGAVLGTAAYMAPEQAISSKVDGRADLFSLGCILYRLAAGRLPWKGSDAMETLVAIASDPPTPVQQLNPGLPPRLAQLIMKLIAKQPEQRPPTARAVVEVIQTIEREQPAAQQIQAALPLAVPLAAPAQLRHDPTEATGMLVRRIMVPKPAWNRRRWLPLAAAVLLLPVALLVLRLVFSGAGSPPKQQSPALAERESKALPQPVLRPETSSIGMKLALIQPGEFIMGCTPEESARFRTNDGEGVETPAHRVKITKPFLMGVYPVTLAQFQQFLRASGYQPAFVRGKALPIPYKQTDDHPVVNVTWNDAVAFCEWLSAKERRRYRLPTEAEWEYACRAGTRTAYFFGDDPQQLGRYGWFDGNSGRQAHPVGQLAPNPWGLYDMCGNVYQWTADWYDPSYYKNSPVEDPPGPTNPPAGQPPFKVMRGGEHGYSAALCRSAARKPRGTVDKYATPRTSFRVVCEAGK